MALHVLSHIENSGSSPFDGIHGLSCSIRRNLSENYCVRLRAILHAVEEAVVQTFQSVPETFHGLHLDLFQRQAMAGINASHSVLVAAPTGTGKTLIADYLVERMIALGGRVVYTAPIKALSNQKFEDYCALLGEDRVGILTGDVSFRPDAPPCIMTAVFRRKQLVAGQVAEEQLAWVIFDEIHYIASDRGIAWEESLILLPPSVHVLGLSATVSNLDALASWMEETSGSPVVRVRENERAVPLHVCYVTPDGLLPYTKVRQAQRSLRWESRQCDHLDIVEAMVEEGALPALFFVFSRAGTEERARKAARRYHFLGPGELRALEAALAEMEGRFGGNRDMHRVLGECLRSGIAFHHAGLLPVTKHIVETLYGQGLIKLLYCTETFAVGVNYPVRSVAMESARKFDGSSFRPLTVQEFQQMTGRAGRRGKDAAGYAFIGVDGREHDPLPNYPALPLEPVESRFFVTESTALNLLDTFGRDRALDVLARNFREYQRRQRRAMQANRLRALVAERDALWQEGCPNLGTAACPLERVHLLRLEAEYRSRRRHRRHRQARLKVDAYLAELREKLQTPAHCPKTPDPCRRLIAPFAQVHRKIVTLEQTMEQTDALENYRDEMEHTLGLLERLGYVEGGRLLPRGQVARNIYVMPLLLTELVFEGFFHAEPEEVINAVLASVDYDARRDDACHGLPHVGAVQTVKRIGRRLLDVGATIRFDPTISPLVAAWSRGMSLSDLMQHTSVQDGDFISAVRRTIDLLRQLKHAVRDDPGLVAKLNRCTKLIDRDEARVML